MTSNIVKRKNIIECLFLAIVVMSFLSFRNLLVVFYLFFALSLFAVLKLKSNLYDLLFIILFIFIAVISSLFEGIYLPKLLFSLYLILTSYLLISSKTTRIESLKEYSLFNSFFTKASILMVFVNISAFIYYFFIVDTTVHNYEDSFTGLYGSAGFGSHTLSLVNLIFSVFYLYKKKLWSFIFFLISGVMGFYGLGLIMFTLTFLLLYSGQMLKHWKLFLTFLLTFFLIGLIISVFNARNLKYIEKNLKQATLVFDSYDYDDEMAKAKSLKVTEIPRFITFLDGAQKRLFTDVKVFFLGTGPGGYNSRTAFYFNGDFVNNKWFKTKFHDSSKYHQEDVFPLINRKLTSKPFNDGTRNQTFSSILSLILENGIFLGGGFLVLFFSKLRSIKKRTSGLEQKRFLDFLFLFTMVVLAFQNYLEYPELILPILLFFKLSEADVMNANGNNN